MQRSVKCKEVYLVTRGCYSDYRVHSVWAKKEDAETVVEIMNERDPADARVEPMPVNRTPMTKRMTYHMFMDTKGEIKISTGDPACGDPPNGPHMCTGGTTKGSWNMTLEALNRDQAKKIFCDAVGQAKAKKEGVA